MSDLQLGLIVIGVLVIVAVFAFNRWQERQLKRRVEDTFASMSQAPVVDAPGDPPPERLEPTTERARLDLDREIGEAPPTATNAQPIDSAPMPPSAEIAPPAPIDYVCSIRAAAPIPYQRLIEFLRAATAIGKRVALEGWIAEAAQWAELPLAEARPMMHVRASLQLADRSGPVNRVQLSTMRDLVRQLARDADADCECPEIDAAAQAAVELDQFCAEIDVSISCHVVPKSDAGLPGTKVRGLLESSGYGLGADGKFWLHAEDGAALLSVADAQAQAFSPERLRGESLAGLTLSMDVPKTPPTGRLFDRMLETARHLAHALDGIVVDDNRKPLTESGLGVIRSQVRAVHSAMETRGIAAGSPTAARLFS